MTATLRNLLSGTLVAALAAGCSSNVTLDPPTIPEPLIVKIPMSVALRLPENFESFEHEEKVLGRDVWKIDLGRSNAVFFEQLFGYMFEDVIIIDAEEFAGGAAQPAFDALIEPSIDAFEFAVPVQTKTDAFAVWIRYRLKIFDRDGDLVANWPVSAYGKSLTTTLGGSDALQRAAVLAMRDAAALMIMKFDDHALIASLADPGSTTAVEDDERAETTAQAVANPGVSDE